MFLVAFVDADVRKIAPLRVFCKKTQQVDDDLFSSSYFRVFGVGRFDAVPAATGAASPKPLLSLPSRRILTSPSSPPASPRPPPAAVRRPCVMFQQQPRWAGFG